MRLVELPDTPQAWLTALHAVLVKYRAKGLGELADEVAALLKHVKRFEEALALDPAESRFVVVTRGEELAAAAHRAAGGVPEGARSSRWSGCWSTACCPRPPAPSARTAASKELNAAKAIEKKIGLPVTVAPALGRHPAGLRELKAFRTAWYALSDCQPRRSTPRGGRLSTRLA